MKPRPAVLITGDALKKLDAYFAEGGKILHGGKLYPSTKAVKPPRRIAKATTA